MHDLAENFVYVPQSIKNTPTEEDQNKPENAKTDLKPFYTNSEPSMRADLNSELASSSIFMSNFFTYSAALGVKGYLAQSLFVTTCFPSGLLLLLHFYAGS